MLNIPCVIFAGGKSSRMGEDKSLLPFGCFESLSEYQYSRLSKIFSHVYISCKNKNKFNFDAEFIEDIQTTDTYAPTLGFISTFQELRCDSFFAISVDAPFIDSNVIEMLLKNDSITNDATVAKTKEGIEPLCGIYHRSLEKKFSLMLQNSDHKLRMLLANSVVSYVTFNESSNFLNLNHPHEYEKAKQLIDC